MPTNSLNCDFKLTSPNFSLFSTEDIEINLYKYLKKNSFNAFLIMFICNHCPYVQTIIYKIVNDVNDLKKFGVLSLAICSNDSIEYPEDSFENMKKFSREKKFSFHYLHDPSQTIAKSYGAVCTPDFFGFNKNMKLCYRGRLDDSTKKNSSTNSKREMFEAMKKISSEGVGPEKQFPSIGCSIKWKI